MGKFRKKRKKTRGGGCFTQRKLERAQVSRNLSCVRALSAVTLAFCRAVGVTELGAMDWWLVAAEHG